MFGITNTNEQIRLDTTELTVANWQSTTTNGVVGFPVRCRIATGPITTVPILERVKLGTNHTEINKDGFIEKFGVAEDRRVLWAGTGESLSAPSGGVNAPTSYDVAISTNVTYRQAFSSYASGSDLRRAGTMLEIPDGVDTSRPLQLEIAWVTDGVSTNGVQWDLYTAPVNIGDTLGALARCSSRRPSPPRGSPGRWCPPHSASMCLRWSLAISSRSRCGAKALPTRTQTRPACSR